MELNRTKKDLYEFKRQLTIFQTISFEIVYISYEDL